MREYKSTNKKLIPRSDHYVYPDNEIAIVRSLVVFQEDDEWEDSGLLDANGHQLVGRKKMNPIGFVYPKK